MKEQRDYSSAVADELARIVEAVSDEIAGIVPNPIGMKERNLDQIRAYWRSLGPDEQAAWLPQLTTEQLRLLVGGSK